MEKKDEIKRLILYLTIFVVILIIINVLIGFFVITSSSIGYPSQMQPWYIFYSVIIPAINALITGISIGFGIIIAYKIIK
jgi:hypothetical protein